MLNGKKDIKEDNTMTFLFYPQHTTLSNPECWHSYKMKYPIAFLFTFTALIFQIVNASPLSTGEFGNVKLNKREPYKCVATVNTNCVHPRNVAEDMEAPTLVKRGHHHGFGGFGRRHFGRHGFGGMFRGWHHRSRFW